MFSRNFMKTFANRKYAQITAKSGSVISDQWLISST
uniref:Predicted protein n=1 Tax=Hordeum vulgare subsp. vulgare TaxID=112509 RepID=F2DFM6_HORVV|nr:predicted protein [Hordeum vulgare subsp. vulgare]